MSKTIGTDRPPRKGATGHICWKGDGGGWEIIKRLRAEGLDVPAIARRMSLDPLTIHRQIYDMNNPGTKKSGKPRKARSYRPAGATPWAGHNIVPTPAAPRPDCTVCGDSRVVPDYRAKTMHPCPCCRRGCK